MFSSTSQLLAKQKLLKETQAEYDNLVKRQGPIYTGTTSTGYTHESNKNYMYDVTPLPGVEPGEDFGEYWKGVKGPITIIDASSCAQAAANDARLFKKVVYTGTTGTNPTRSDWDNKCYGLVYDADPEAIVTTNNAASGYVTMTPSGVSGYTKLGITHATSDIININNAAKIYELEQKIKGLVADIVRISPKTIDAGLKELNAAALLSSNVNDNIHAYMINAAADISKNYVNNQKRQNQINILDEVNSQVQLKSKKYWFVLYSIIGILIIFGYYSYASELPVSQQYDAISGYFTASWWTSWKVVFFVVVIILMSSLGWDMRGNIAMVFRYISDPTFWSGELWWIGISLLLVVIIYFYTSFKSFFT